MFRMTLLQHQSKDHWASKEGPVKLGKLNTDKNKELKKITTVFFFFMLSLSEHNVCSCGSVVSHAAIANYY